MLLDQKDVVKLINCAQKRVDRHTSEKQGWTGQCDTPYYMEQDLPILLCDKSKDQDVEALLATQFSLIPRAHYSGIKKNLRRLVCPPPFVTRKNVDLLLSQLFERSDRPRVLIVGGGTIGEGMEPFYTDSRIELISFDIYPSPNVQFVADAHCIPLKEDSFDAVIVQAVLEHVFYPDRVVEEVHRVLKDDGFVYAETPFLQQVHEGAYDFTRYTESGHRLLFRHFRLIKSGACSGAGTQLLWALEGFFTGLFRSKYLGKLVKVLFFWIMLFDYLIPDSYNIDSANGVYFLGSKSSSTVSELDIVQHYNGAQ
ncbi:class I SAM-dependent methyltransferase [Enterovibrio sp. ZSDZ35]|uniref:Class I SAM-dependent methyltransferase n=1 Tax=Enterovibrio qingdaonensis TaxID=2899818 RepID=A0ABT5QRN3_9GAMM|nr:class I SAM-dependent methyltransferase [Enterovibrio sp. ZSDZ35]MDD1783632.1 class I SAM-dependent methyltransferase [Enterovibrio sp. ZSDZ35]